MWIDLPTWSNVAASFALSHVLYKIHPKAGKICHSLTIRDHNLKEIGAGKVYYNGNKSTENF